MTSKLDNWRKEIDTLDKELLIVLAKRMNVVKEIGKIKKEKNLPTLDKKRWSHIVSSILSYAESLNLPKKLVEELFETIHKHSLKLQKEGK